MSDKLQEFQNNAGKLIREKNWDELISECTEIIRLETDETIKALIYNYRGYAYNEKGEYDLAIADYTESIKLKPSASAYSNRGSAYNWKGDYDSAIKDCTESIKLKPNDSAYSNRGCAYTGKGDYDSAIKDYTESIKLKPNAPAYSNRGSAYNWKRDYDSAIKDCTESIKLKPNAPAYSNRGSAYNGKGDYDSAIKDFNDAIKLEPKNASFYNNRGAVYFYKGDYNRAIENFDNAINLEPENASFYNNRGNSYFHKRNYARAIEDYTESIKLKPNDPAYSNRGSAYNEKGDYDSAFQDLMKVVDNKVLKSTYPLVYITSKIKYITSDHEEQSKLFKYFSKLRTAIEKIRKKIFDKSKNTEEVAHYTSLHVLKCLANKKSFRLYNAAYMNDPEEGWILFEIMKDKFKMDVKEYFYKRNAEKFNLSPAYIGSFVEVTPPKPEKDELFFWCTYGKHDNEKATGTCLIFKTGQFAKEVSQVIGTMSQLQGNKNTESEQKPPPELYKVFYKNDIEYEEDMLKALEELALALPLEDIKELCDKHANKKELIIRLVQEMLDSIRFLFKANHYKEEREVRVAKMFYDVKPEAAELEHTDGKELSEHKVDMKQIPPRSYLEMPSNILPREVILGPNSSNISKWRQLLKEKGINAEVKKSNIKFGNNRQ